VFPGNCAPLTSWLIRTAVLALIVRHGSARPDEGIVNPARAEVQAADATRPTLESNTISALPPAQQSGEGGVRVMPAGNEG